MSKVAIMLVYAIMIGVIGSPRAVHAGGHECPVGSKRVTGVPEDKELSGSLGVLEATWCEVNGLKEGIYRERYPDGQVFREIEFRNGKRHGQSASYFKSGKRWRESTYVEGKPSGRATAWNESGRVVEVTDYELRGDDLYARFESWYPDGRKLAEGELLNNKLHGRMIFFDQQGNQTLEIYQQGKRISSKPLH